MIDYLVGIEVEHMGASMTLDTRARGETTVAASRSAFRFV